MRVERPRRRRAADRFSIDYVDMNAEVAGLGPEVEFYTDSCRLTPQANERVAEILVRIILANARRAKAP